MSSALEIRQSMRAISKEWQLRKGWPLDLCLNSGVDEGQEWLGKLKSSTQPEFAGLAGTLRRATRLAESAPAGAVWVTKNLVIRLSDEEQRQLQYGVRHRSAEGNEVFVASVFAPAASLRESCTRLPECIARVPITEIVDIAPAGAFR